MTHNQINYWNLQETKRHNLVGEQETSRHNRATESVDLGKLSESNRHNLATESKDLGNLKESIRHNVATENLTSRDLNIAAGTLAENRRHNISSESISNKLADSNVELNQANAALAQVRTTWETLNNSANLELTQAQKDEVQGKISKLEAETKNLNAQTDKTHSDIVWKTYDEVLHLLESLIPG